MGDWHIGLKDIFEVIKECSKDLLPIDGAVSNQVANWEFGILDK